MPYWANRETPGKIITASLAAMATTTSGWYQVTDDYAKRVLNSNQRSSSGGAGGGSAGGGGSMNVNMSRLLKSMEASDKAAKKATEKRYKAAMGKMQTIESIYSPGGAFGKSYAAYLAGQKEESVASGTQSLVGSGLYGTTTQAGLGTVWDKKVGAPAMAEFQRMQMGKYAEALQGTAGLLERREDIGPDYGMIAQLMAKAGSA